MYSLLPLTVAWCARVQMGIESREKDRSCALAAYKRVKGDTSKFSGSQGWPTLTEI